MPQVYTWGLDPTQQQKKDQKCCLPKHVTTLQDKDIVQVVAGSHCNAALSSMDIPPFLLKCACGEAVTHAPPIQVKDNYQKELGMERQDLN